jgi:hypothetical protein
VTPVTSGVDGTTVTQSTLSYIVDSASSVNGIKLRACADANVSDGRINSVEVHSENFTRIATPSPTAVYNTATEEIDLSWGSITGASALELTLPDASTLNRDAADTGYSYAPGAGTSFTFSLKALGSAGSYTRNSTSGSVTIYKLTAPTVSIGYSDDDGCFVASWSAVTHATGYTVTPAVTGGTPETGGSQTATSYSFSRRQ